LIFQRGSRPVEPVRRDASPITREKLSMAKEAYRTVDMDADVAKAAGPLAVMTYPKGMKFKVEVEFDDKMKKEIGADALLKQDMWLEVDKVYSELVKRIGENLKNTDRGAIQLRDKKEIEKLKKLVDVVNKGIVGAKEIAEESAQKKIMAHYDGLKKKRKEYTKYKIKIVVTITSATAGLATSLALIGASGFSGGASGAIGIIAMFKSCMVLATEVVAAAQTVQESIGTLEVQLGVVEKIWKETKVGSHANEISAAVFKEFLGVSQPSVKSCQSNLSTAKNKLNGIDVNTHDMAKQVQKAMAKAKEMQNEFIAKANERLKKHPDPQALKKYGPQLLTNMNKYMKGADEQIRKLLQRIVANVDVIKKATNDVKLLEARVEAISKVRDPKAYKVLDNLLAVGNVSLSVLNGNGLVDCAKAVQENVVPVVTLFAFDKITAVVIEGDLKAALS
jgi:hypothetical protein